MEYDCFRDEQMIGELEDHVSPCRGHAVAAKPQNSSMELFNVYSVRQISL